jgi:hypothetical protein
MASVEKEVPDGLATIQKEFGWDAPVIAKEQSAKKLHELGLAMHNYQDKFGNLPPAAIFDKSGNPLLSWRVLLLPFLEEEDLYSQFKLGEPWDSPNNRNLLERIPTQFRSTGEKGKESYATYYQVFTGPGTLFEGKKGIKFSDVTDGTSNTIMIIEGGDSVPWTKPVDLPYDPSKPMPMLGGMYKTGCHIVTADGAVHFARKPFDERLIRAAITRNGGEAINISDLFDR